MKLILIQKGIAQERISRCLTNSKQIGESNDYKRHTEHDT